MNTNTKNILHSNIATENFEVEREENEEIVYNKNITAISFFSTAMMHTFFLSVFEGTFYWIYIVKQERKVILRYMKELKIIINPICDKYSSDIDFDSILKSIKYEDSEDNIKGPLTSTIGLSVIIFLLTISLCCLNILTQLNNKKYTWKIFILYFYYDILNTFKISLVPICIISLYEIIFFQMVVYTYNPVSKDEIILKVLNYCMK